MLLRIYFSDMDNRLFPRVLVETQTAYSKVKRSNHFHGKFEMKEFENPPNHPLS